MDTKYPEIKHIIIRHPKLELRHLSNQNELVRDLKITRHGGTRFGTHERHHTAWCVNEHNEPFGRSSKRQGHACVLRLQYDIISVLPLKLAIYFVEKGYNCENTR